MVEKQAVGTHGGIERLFARMAEGRMAEVVYEGEGFSQVYVEAEGSGNGARYLRDFDGVGEAVAEVVGVAASENLSLIFETAEGASVDNAVAVALEIVAIGMRRFREAASAGMFHLHRVGGQHGRSLTESWREFAAAKAPIQKGVLRRG